jgi:YVTN family beta-propeller protein
MKPEVVVSLGRPLALAAVLAAVLAGTPDPGTAGYAYLASRRQPAIFVLDTTTAAYVARAPGRDFVSGSYATVDPSGSTVGVATTVLGVNGPPYSQPALTVLDASTNAYAGNIPLMEPSIGANLVQGGLAVHPGGRTAYVGLAPDRSVAVVDVTARMAVASAGVFSGGASAMVVHPAGTFLYVAGDDTLSVVDTTTNSVIKTVAVASAGPVAVRPDGASVYVVSEPLGSLSVVRTSDHTVVGAIALPCPPSALAAAPDGARLYVAHRTCPFLSVVDAATAQLTGTIPLPVAADGVDVDPTGTAIVAVNSGAGRDDAFVVFVDLERATVVRTAGLPGPVHAPLGRFVGPPLPPGRRPPGDQGPLPPAPTTRSRLVRSLYDSALGRLATDGEVQSWLAFLGSRGSAAGLRALMTGVLTSEEMLGLAVTPATFAQLLYRGILGREPDAAGVATWIAVLSEQLATPVPGFVGSTEFQLTSAALPPAALVARLYLEFLGRAASADESAGWTDYLARTGDAGGVVRAFLLSDEYLARPRSPLEHITGLYRALLGRDPEPAALAAWIGYMAAQRAAVVEAFVNTPEFTARLSTVVD